MTLSERLVLSVPTAADAASTPRHGAGVALRHDPCSNIVSIVSRGVGTQATSLPGWPLMGFPLCTQARWLCSLGPCPQLPPARGTRGSSSPCSTDRGRIYVSALGMSMIVPAMFGVGHAPYTGLPYFRPDTVQALVEWCATIASAAPTLPFYFYDIPALTGVSLSMERFLVEAIGRIPNFAGIKFSNPDLASYRRCLDAAAGRIDLPWGVDATLLAALATGARGTVGSTYNFAPRLYHDLIARLRALGFDDWGTGSR